MIKTGRDIAAERTRFGATQAELADELGVSRTFLSQIETSRDVVPTIEFSKRVEAALAKLAKVEA